MYKYIWLRMAEGRVVDRALMDYVLLPTHNPGGMPLHDAVGINCKKGTTTEYQDSAVKYMG